MTDTAAPTSTGTSQRARAVHGPLRRGTGGGRADLAPVQRAGRGLA